MMLCRSPPIGCWPFLPRPLSPRIPNCRPQIKTLAPPIASATHFRNERAIATRQHPSSRTPPLKNLRRLRVFSGRDAKQRSSPCGALARGRTLSEVTARASTRGDPPRAWLAPLQSDAVQFQTPSRPRSTHLAWPKTPPSFFSILFDRHLTISVPCTPCRPHVAAAVGAGPRACPLCPEPPLALAT